MNEELQDLWRAVQISLERGASEEHVMSQIRHNPAFQALPSPQQTIAGLRSAASTPSRPSPEDQLRQRASEMMLQGASRNQADEMIAQESGGQYNSMAELQQTYALGDDRVRELLQRREETQGRRAQAKERVGDLTAGDVGLQVIRGVPFVGEFLAEGAARAGLDVPASLIQAGGDPNRSMRGVLDAHRGRSGDERAQRLDDVGDAHPVLSGAAQLAGGVGGAGAMLRAAGFAANLSGAGGLLTAQRPAVAKATQAFRGRTPESRQIVGEVQDQMAARMVNLPPGQSAATTPLMGVVGRSAVGVGTAGVLGTADAAGRIAGQERGGNLFERAQAVADDPGALLMGAGASALPLGILGVGSAARTGVEQVSMLRRTSPARVAKTVENITSNPPARALAAQEQFAKQQLRASHIRPLEATALPPGVVTQLRDNPVLAQKLRKAQPSSAGGREPTWAEMNEVRSALRRDAKSLRAGNHVQQADELELLLRDLNDQMDVATRVPRASGMRPRSLDREFRQQYRDLILPAENYELGRTFGFQSADHTKMMIDDLATREGAVAAEMFRAGRLRKYLDDWRNQTGVPNVSEGHWDEIRHLLGGDVATFREVRGVLEQELRNRRMEGLIENILKFGSFSIMGSSVLAGSALSAAQAR